MSKYNDLTINLFLDDAPEDRVLVHFVRISLREDGGLLSYLYQSLCNLICFCFLAFDGLSINIFLLCYI